MYDRKRKRKRERKRERKRDREREREKKSKYLHIVSRIHICSVLSQYNYLVQNIL